MMVEASFSQPHNNDLMLANKFKFELPHATPLHFYGLSILFYNLAFWVNFTDHNAVKYNEPH